MQFLLICCLEFDKVVQLLIQRGADINHVGNDGFTPLLNAIGIQDENSARILIEHGANINAQNSDGDTGLILAASNSAGSNSKNQLYKKWKKKTTNNDVTDHERIIKMLIENGADVNHKGAYGKTPLMLMAGEGNTKVAFLFRFTSNFHSKM